MKVSVIVPVYDVEKYLDTCISSIVNQTYNELEIILVDDGSPDNCPQMCDAWAEKDNRIIVIHKENGGLSSARNTALASINGEYIAFVDSDDWISPNWIEVLYDSIQKNGSLISIGEICSCSIIRKKYSPITDDEECLLSPIQMIKYISESNIRSTVTNKLYHKSLFENTRFPEGRINEDACITHELIGRCEKISYAKGCYYYIRIRNGSITKQSFSIKNLDLLYASDNMVKYYVGNYPELVRLALAHRINEILYLLKSLFFAYGNKSCKDIESQLRNTLTDTLEKYKDADGEMYGYSISDDVALYLENRTKFIKKCRKGLLYRKVREFTITIISIFRKKNY